jgi:hypothetical protein
VPTYNLAYSQSWRFSAISNKCLFYAFGAIYLFQSVLGLQVGVVPRPDGPHRGRLIPSIRLSGVLKVGVWSTRAIAGVCVWMCMVMCEVRGGGGERMKEKEKQGKWERERRREREALLKHIKTSTHTQMFPVNVIWGQRCGLHMTATTAIPDAVLTGLAFSLGRRAFLWAGGTAAMMSTSLGWVGRPYLLAIWPLSLIKWCMCMYACMCVHTSVWTIQAFHCHGVLTCWDWHLCPLREIWWVVWLSQPQSSSFALPERLALLHTYSTDQQYVYVLTKDLLYLSFDSFP